MIYCCESMKYTIEDPRICIKYDQRYKEFYVETKESVVIYVINYCPWCATKLPKSLNNKWFEILEEECSLDDPDSKEQSKLIPEEFKTDEWWKKRGY